MGFYRHFAYFRDTLRILTPRCVFYGHFVDFCAFYRFSCNLRDIPLRHGACSDDLFMYGSTFSRKPFFFFFFKSHWDYGIKLVENHLKHILRLFWRFFKISSYELFCVQNSVYFLYKNWTLSLPYDLTSKAIALQLVSCDSEWSKVVYSVDFFFSIFRGVF